MQIYNLVDINGVIKKVFLNQFLEIKIDIFFYWFRFI